MPDSAGYPAPDPLYPPHCKPGETFIDNEGIARIRPNCIPGPELVATSGQGPVGADGAQVGRMVQYYRQFDGLVSGPRQALAAVITEVHGNGFVALEVFGQPERVIHRTVPFFPTIRGGCWTWLPR